MIIIGNDSDDNLELDGLAGIEIRSRRGSIGAGFWGRRWMDYFDSDCDPVELENGRRLARKSQVYQVKLLPGRISGVAAEMRQEPYMPYMEVSTLDPQLRDAILKWVEHQPEVTAYLFAGILPEGFLDIVGESQMVPESGHGGCNCEWLIGPCRHQIAMHCVLAEYLDRYPWAIVELLGLSHLELCNHVRKCWGVAPVEKNETGDHGASGNITEFYGSVAKIPQDTALQELMDLDALERLGAPPFFPAGERNLKRTLEKLYEE